jgi:hypothetical protein
LNFIDTCTPLQVFEASRRVSIPPIRPLASSLKRLKSYLRNSMGEERLLGIALLNIERDFEINLDQIVTDFIAKKDIRKTIF